MNNKKDNGPLSGFGFIVALIIAFNIFWPAGIALLLWKIGLFSSLKDAVKNNASQDYQQSQRFEKYKVMTSGRSAESIDYLASAAGVSYATALSDLQKMVASGQLGSKAYINYVDKTLVLVPETRSGFNVGAAPAGRRTSDRVTSAPGTTKTSERVGGNTGRKTSDQSAKDDSIKTAGKDPGKVYDTLRTILLISGILLLGFGFFRIIDPLYWLLENAFSRSDLTNAVIGGAMMGSGVFSIVYRAFLKKRENRFKVYEAACMGKDYISLADLASKSGVSLRKVTRDVEAMMDKGLFPSTAYIDKGDGMLILKPGASPKVADEPEVPKDDEDRYRSVIKEIRDLNDAIPDPDMSVQIDEIEQLTMKIFQAVQEKPEKEPQIKSFMSYYLPTTLKLLRSYAEFESSGAGGDNINAAKAEIEHILDTLVDGFHKQLDKLYESEAMDISSDIDVLETMLRRDGLTGDGSPFGTATQKKQ